MSPAERARRWFQRHAQARTSPEGAVLSYGVEWSEEVEASLAAEMSLAVMAPTSLPSHEPWPSQTAKPRWPRTEGPQHVAPCNEADRETWP